MKLRLFKMLQEEFSFWLEGMLTSLPYSRIGNHLRRLYWSRKLQVPNRDIIICPGVRFFCTESLNIGKRVELSTLTFLIDPCDGFISIGNNVIIGPNCVLRAADHIYSDITKAIKFQGHRGGI